jgi:hypothetical protein
VAALAAPDPGEALGNDPTTQKPSELLLHEGGVTKAVLCPSLPLLEERLEVIPDERIQRRLLRLPPAV